MSISGAQLTKLGERLRAGPLSEADLRMLDEYRRSFGPASERVLATLRETMDVPVTVRGAKSTQAIVEKLRRQSCRLGQIQDIAGCRLVVEALEAQDAAVSKIRAVFADVLLHDRRETPSHGYRAVHLVAKVLDRWVEIQVRTELQHQWASLSEMLADTCGIEVKYGGGPAQVQTVLTYASRIIATREQLDRELRELTRSVPKLPVLPAYLLNKQRRLSPEESELLEQYRALENAQGALKSQLRELEQSSQSMSDALRQALGELSEALAQH